MAKRKAARAPRTAKKAPRKAAAARKAGAPKRRAAARKAAQSRKKAAGRKTMGRKTAARKAARKAPARTARARKAPARTGAARKAGPARKAPIIRRAAAPKTRTTSARKAPAPKMAERKAPSLDRARRVVLDDDIVLSPPSTLDMDRSASAARSGRRALEERLEEHTETGPRMTAGDIDADWESAYSVGDEAPGGDNPTPDQDIVDDIGRALGNEYQDNEPLKGADKIAQRDRHRWELDPGSKEDFGDDDV